MTTGEKVGVGLGFTALIGLGAYALIKSGVFASKPTTPDVTCPEGTNLTKDNKCVPANNTLDNLTNGGGGGQCRQGQVFRNGRCVPRQQQQQPWQQLLNSLFGGGPKGPKGTGGGSGGGPSGSGSTGGAPKGTPKNTGNTGNTGTSPYPDASGMQNYTAYTYAQYDSPNYTSYTYAQYDSPSYTAYNYAAYPGT